jgi:hypothetical protein
MPAIALIVCAIVWSGWHWAHREPASVAALAPAERAVLVADSTGLLCAQFLPAKTTLHIVGGPKNLLAPELEASLRQHGFAVRVGAPAEDKTARIVVVPVDHDGLLLRLAVAQDWGADRLYRRVPAGVVPETGFAIRD